MGLRLDGARADRAPAHQVGHVLRRDRIEELRGRGQPQIKHVAQERAPEAQPGRDVVGPVEVGIHHEPLPADGRAGFLEIDPHRDQHAVGYRPREGGEAARVIPAGVHIVDRTRADDEQEAADRR